MKITDNLLEIGWTDVGSGGYILVSCAHSNTSFIWNEASLRNADIVWFGCIYEFAKQDPMPTL
jgi:hypothetical protein